MASPYQQQTSKANVQARSTAEAGNGLFATRQIGLDDVVLSVAPPLVVALDTPRLKDTCYHCFSSVDGEGEGEEEGERKGDRVAKILKTCTGCGVVRYCDKPCQKTSWTHTHKRECKLFARLHPHILPNHVRAVVHLLLLHKAKRFPAGEWAQLLQLESHVADFQAAGGEFWQDLCLMTKAARDYSGTTLDGRVVLELFCSILINSFTLALPPSLAPLGLALHPLPALLNHSCAYNATVRFAPSTSSSSLPLQPQYHPHNSTTTTNNNNEGLSSRVRTGPTEGPIGPAEDMKIEVVAFRQIEKGEEILVSYIDAEQGYEVRQGELRERYFFECRCVRCREEGQGGKG